MKFQSSMRRISYICAISFCVSSSTQLFAQNNEEERELDTPGMLQRLEADGVENTSVESEEEREGKKVGRSAVQESEGDAPEVYVVQPGDTLWNLSDRFLSNPWYWPKVWSYNPHVENPNWIEPGSVIRFYPGVDQAPVEVEVEEEDLDIPDVEEVKGFNSQEVTQKLVRMMDFKGYSVRRQFFVPSEKLDSSGRITASNTMQKMLSRYDRFWAEYKDTPDVGATAMVYSIKRDLKHPLSGASLGKVVEVIGKVKVLRVEGNRAFCEIAQSFAPVRRDDYIASFDAKAFGRVSAVSNENEVRGYIADTARSEHRSVGEMNYIFIDQGKEEGVNVGNTFTVVRALDPLLNTSDNLMDENIGTVLMTDVHDHVSTGVIINSNRELRLGDRVIMEVGGNS